MGFEDSSIQGSKLLTRGNRVADLSRNRRTTPVSRKAGPPGG
jgi:hypothetical protein